MPSSCMEMCIRDRENAISVRDVTKVYRLYDKPIDRLKESVSISHKNYHRDFYALKGLSFQVKKGETVGIIGTNGSGKSTILKIITGVLTPTSGQVDVDGKISALLELGAGFNMDYTGIENVYMNGTMMGYTKKEMDAKPVSYTHLYGNVLYQFRGDHGSYIWEKGNVRKQSYSCGNASRSIPVFI